ncbi:unnamed protein product [Closterium sp. Naga37s-1]|nr:unnamed protein product [Closterium sp. Naga37s-1]
MIYVFNRNGCIFYREWYRPNPPNTDDHKLMFGLVFSLRSFTAKMDPVNGASGDGCSFQSFRTNTYKLNYLETPSGIKIILVTDPKMSDLRDSLKHIYTNIYVEYVIKNPLYVPGEPFRLKDGVTVVEDQSLGDNRTCEEASSRASGAVGIEREPRVSRPTVSSSFNHSFRAQSYCNAHNSVTLFPARGAMSHDRLVYSGDLSAEDFRAVKQIRPLLRLEYLRGQNAANIRHGLTGEVLMMVVTEASDGEWNQRPGLNFRCGPETEARVYSNGLPVGINICSNYLAISPPPVQQDGSNFDFGPSMVELVKTWENRALVLSHREPGGYPGAKVAAFTKVGGHRMNPDKSPFQRTYANQVKRCGEMSRKLRYLKEQSLKAGILPTQPRTLDKDLDLDDLELKLNDLEAELLEINGNAEKLLKTRNELTELKLVLEKAGSFFASAQMGAADYQQVIERVSSIRESASMDSPLLLEQEMASDSSKRLGFVTGLVPLSKVLTFERLLFRATRGNMFLKQEVVDEPVLDPATGEQVEKVVFVVEKVVFVVFFSGERARTKIMRICEAFGANRYPFPEEPARQRQMLAEMLSEMCSRPFPLSFPTPPPPSLRPSPLPPFSHSRPLIPHMHNFPLFCPRPLVSSSEVFPAPSPLAPLHHPPRSCIPPFLPALVSPYRHVQVRGRLGELQTAIDAGNRHRDNVLNSISVYVDRWTSLVRNEKAVYHVLNQLSIDVTRKCLVAEAWCPTSALVKVQEALERGMAASNAAVSTIFHTLRSHEAPPTFFRTNKFTSAFQAIVDAYGVARYQEANPGVFSIMTFPFLFAIMFGDWGHGTLMLLASLYLVLNEKKLGSQARAAHLPPSRLPPFHAHAAL